MNILERLELFLTLHWQHDACRIGFDNEGDYKTQMHVVGKCCGDWFDRFIPWSSPYAMRVWDHVARWSPVHLRAEPVPVEARIWRYMTLDRLIWILQNRALYCRRLDLLQDQFEGALPESYPKTPAPVSVLRQMSFVSCWHINELEHAGLWEQYATRFGRKAGVSIQSTRGRIGASIGNHFGLSLARIRYIDYRGFELRPDEWHHFNPMFHKRVEFEHEREFRIGFYGTDVERSTTTPNGQAAAEFQPLDVDLNVLIERVVVAPGSSDEAIRAATAVVAATGVTARVERSAIDAPPRY